MLFKSPIFAQASGSIAGTVFSRNAGGMYVRSRANPTNPNTEAQQAVRDAMRTLVHMWTLELSDIERDIWTTYAFNTPTLNKLGEPTHKTGQQMFLRGNIPRLQAGLPVAKQGPTVFNTGTFTPPTEWVADVAAGTTNFNITVSDPWTHETGSALLVYQSRPQSATRNFGKGPFQLATIIQGSSGPPLIAAQSFLNLFVADEGAKFFYQVRLSSKDGRLSGKVNPTAITTLEP